MKFTDEQKQAIAKAYKEARVEFDCRMNDSQTRSEIQDFFQQRLPFIEKIVCDDSNNTPETIDLSIAIVSLGDEQIIIGRDWGLCFEDDEVEAVRHQIMEIHHDDQPNEVMDKVGEALEVFGLEVLEEFNDASITYTIRQKQ